MKVCVDYDGSSGSKLSGDSGATVYIAGVTAVNRTSIRRGMNQALMLTCREGCLHAVSQVFLALDCAKEKLHTGVGINYPDKSISTARAPMVGTTTVGIFEVTLDTRVLPLGVELRLCTDLDGSIPKLVSGDAGHALHASAVALRSSTASSQAIMNLTKAAGQEVRLSCPEGCTMDTSVSLVSEVSSCSDTAATRAELWPDGEDGISSALGGYGNVDWKVTFDASVLTVGRYRLCADLDGHGPVYTPGDTGDLVDVVASR